MFLKNAFILNSRIIYEGCLICNVNWTTVQYYNILNNLVDELLNIYIQYQHNYSVSQSFKIIDISIEPVVDRCWKNG